MSRIAKYPVKVPSGIEVKLAAGQLSVKGPKGALAQPLHPLVEVKHESGELRFARKNDSIRARAMSGTLRALANNMIVGVTKGFEKKLVITGVGFRAAMQGKKLNLTLGYSHPIVYEVPVGITIEAPDQTNLVVKGADRRLVGQVAADIRAFRPPEPYKGKGVKYADERIVRKEAKKK